MPDGTGEVADDRSTRLVEDQVSCAGRVRGSGEIIAVGFGVSG